MKESKNMEDLTINEIVAMLKNKMEEKNLITIKKLEDRINDILSDKKSSYLKKIAILEDKLEKQAKINNRDRKESWARIGQLNRVILEHKLVDNIEDIELLISRLHSIKD